MKLPCTLAISTLLFCAASTEAFAKELRDFTFSDFIASAGGHQTGPVTFEIFIEVFNPTAESICIYPAIVSGVQVVQFGATYMTLYSAIDATGVPPEDKYLLHAGLFRGEPQHMFSEEVGPTYPGISLEPGDHYTISQEISVRQYATVNGRAPDKNVGEMLSAPVGPYVLELGPELLFRCGRLNGAFIRKFQRTGFSYHSEFTREISGKFPDGDYWRFKSGVVVGTPFDLNLPPIPDGYEVVIVD